MNVVYAYVNGKIFTKAHFSCSSWHPDWQSCRSFCNLSDGCHDRSEKRKEFGNKSCKDLIGSYFTCFVSIGYKGMNIEGGI